MRAFRDKYYAILIVLLSACCYSASCVRAAKSEPAESIEPTTQQSFDKEDDIKIHGLSNSPDGIRLNLNRSISSERVNELGLVYPISIAADDNGSVYISDNNAHRISLLPRQSDHPSMFPILEGNGQLVWPNTIRLSTQSILVSDNDGIKCFGRDGSFQRLLRIYYQASSFDIDHNGNFFVNPQFSVQKEDNPLIVKLNNNGKFIKGFGERVAPANHFGLDDKAYVSCTEGYVFVAFAYRPEIQVFDVEGTLLKAFGIDHPSFNQLASLLSDEQFVHPDSGKLRLPRYVAGLSVVRDRILVLLDLPMLEIQEFDFQGRLIQRYTSTYHPYPKARCRAFDAHLINNSYSFWAVVGNSKDNAFVIIEFTASRQA